MRSMTLRTEIEALLEEFEHFAYEGAPLDVAVDKLQEILAKTAPRVLTTVEELDSEEAAKALCLIPNDGSRFLSLYWRRDGKNDWVGPASDHFHSSAEVLADFALMGVDPEFVVVNSPDDVTTAAPRILTTAEELDSEEASKALCLVPNYDLFGIVVPYGRTGNGSNMWVRPGNELFYTTSELIGELAVFGAEPAFTLVEKP